MKHKVLNILFWSILSAAFIGPGTITTAAKAGASYGYSLLWALAFSTFACLVLQEAAARLSIVSNKSLGRAIAEKYRNKKGGWIIFVLVTGAIIIGSAAYETGNLIGAAEGIKIVDPFNPVLWVILIATTAALALLFPRLQVLARALGILVVLMGIVFLITALLLKPDLSEILKGEFIPYFPQGSAMLILALVGTTVVPYNLFLGSGVADKSQSISDMHFGLAVAIILGGIISMAVLVVGASVEGTFSFEALAHALSSKLGHWAVWFFGFGLFAAGFSSAITAPLASALTARDLFQKKEAQKWNNKGIYFKLTWGFVLATGLFFGTIGLKPIPAIIAAQALNGLILPFISIFLWFAVNDVYLMKTAYMNSTTGNVFYGAVVWITLLLGVQNLVNAFSKAMVPGFWQSQLYYFLLLTITFIITALIFYGLYRKRKAEKNRNE